MSKEDCQRHGGRGRWEGTGASLEGCSLTSRSSLPRHCGSLGHRNKGRGASWLLSLCCSGRPACKPPFGVWPRWGDASRLGTARAACGCVAASRVAWSGREECWLQVRALPQPGMGRGCAFCLRVLPFRSMCQTPLGWTSDDRGEVQTVKLLLAGCPRALPSLTAG